MNLILSSPSILAISPRSSANVTLSSSVFPYELTFCPRSITSFTPSATSLSISLIISFGSLDFSRPLTYGTIQYVQKLLQPNIILTPDLNGYFLEVGSSSTTSLVESHISIICSSDVNLLYNSSANLNILNVPNTTSTNL